MISIIIIGKNESWRLTKCLDSIEILINNYKDIQFEVIYVDSYSSDDSIKRALAFKNIEIYLVTGKKNAAVARNIGAIESTGNILFFVDGDMELDQQFLNYALDSEKNLISKCLTGHLNDCIYDANDVLLGVFPRTYNKHLPNSNMELKFTGGIFLIEREVWSLVQGMNTKFKINEDFDLSMRLGNKKIKIIRLPHHITVHHTIDYRDESRMWSMLWNGYGLYPGLMFREYFLNTVELKKIIRSEYSAILLLVFALSIISEYRILLVGAIFFIVLTSRVFMHTKKEKGSKNKLIYFFKRLILQGLLDISFWIGFLMFYPKKITLDYKRVL
ncbi:glycosyltransferase family 2 protein [Flavobacterium weaverense]|uniref:GT2 family glycosyltransferase n=1 Tax=Flavobacterium weaverense TaxID=271156 RepID=A0A3L9ZJR4_9FLAO|nr:glycosyltransferase [Flavobacterium weaverense]RMA73103.1 GT2 family glycosyltransferase [Flavobacterium weaverense]